MNTYLAALLTLATCCIGTGASVMTGRELYWTRAQCAETLDEGVLVPGFQLDRKLGRAELFQVGGEGVQSFELSRVPSLRLQKLLIQAFSHDQQEPTRNPTRHKYASFSGADELTKQRSIKDEGVSNQN